MAGVEPAPPRCKRGALPPELHPPKVRTDGVEPPQRGAPGLQPGELADAQRPHEGVADRIRTDASGITTPGAAVTPQPPWTGTTGIEPATARLTSECSCRLSYAPTLRRWDSNPRSRAHEAREDGRSSTALGLAGRTRTCDLRFPKPVGCQAPLRPDGVPPAGVEPAASGLRVRRHPVRPRGLET
jgi:hypothetical protein